MVTTVRAEATEEISGSGGASRSRSHVYALPAGSRLHEFEIRELLGYGGFGITYLAEDTLLQERVALKEYLPNELAVRVSDDTVRPRADDDEPNFAEGLGAFLEEARLMARFRHPRLVHVRRFFRMHGTGYIVLDFEDGTTLSERLAGGPLPEAELRGILAGVMDGLSVVHDRAILHRDLKPSNIMLRADGSPVVIDFGAARDFYSRKSASVTAIASPGYSPPEQYGAGGEQGPWTDLYALGAVAYRCVTGIVPPDSLRRLRKDPLVPAAILAAGRYDDVLLRTIDWMMRVDETERPASVKAVRDALEGARPPPVSSATIKTGEGGRVQLDFGCPIEADRLELAVIDAATGRHLAPDGSGWGTVPHYLPVLRDAANPTRAVFTLEAGADLAAGARIFLISQDDRIHATACWPAPHPVKPPASSTRRFAAVVLVVGLLVLVGSLAGAIWLNQGQQRAAEEAPRAAWDRRLTEARFDRGALSQILEACGSACPDLVRTEAQGRLDRIAAEEARYRRAGRDPSALRDYARDCQACLFKAEAVQRAMQIEAQQAETFSRQQAEEQRRQAEAAQRAEEQRLQAEAAQRVEEQRRQAEAAQRVEEQRRQAEAASRAEEQRRQAEAASRAEEQRRQAEAAQRVEEQRQQAEAASRAEEQRRQAEAAQRAESERRAADRKKQEDDQRRAEERRRAEARRRAEEEQRRAARQAEERRRAEEQSAARATHQSSAADRPQRKTCSSFIFNGKTVCE